MSGDGAGSSLEEEKRQAIQKNLMGSSEEEVEDNLDDIDKADLDEFLMNKEGEKEEENKHRKLAEGKRKRRHDSKEDTVSRKKRRGPKSEVSVFDQQLQTMSGVEVKDGVAAEAILGAVDNEEGEGEVVSHLLNETVVIFNRITSLHRGHSPLLWHHSPDSTNRLEYLQNECPQGSLRLHLRELHRRYGRK